MKKRGGTTMNKWAQRGLVTFLVVLFALGVFVYVDPFAGSNNDLTPTRPGSGVQSGEQSDSRIKLGPYTINQSKDWRAVGKRNPPYQQLILWYRGEQDPSAYIIYGPNESGSLPALIQSQTGGDAAYPDGEEPTVKLTKIAGEEAAIVSIPILGTGQVRLVALQYNNGKALQMVISGPASAERVLESRLRSYLAGISR
jgi:hypothetical protein